MKVKACRFFFLLCGLAVSSAGLSQGSVGSYFMDILPRRSMMNPAFIAPYESSFGFPGLSGLNAHVDNNFLSWNSLVTRGADDSLRIDVPRVIGKAGHKARLAAYVDVEIFRYSWRRGKNNYQAGLSAHADAHLLLGKETLSFLLQGPGAHTGENHLVGNRVDMNSYVYLYFGYSRVINRRLTVGGRFKLLHGLWNFHTKNLDIRFDIQNEDMSDPELVPYQFHLQVQGTLQSNLPMENDFVFGSFSVSLFRNMGAALDLGISYDFGNGWNVSASMLDLGFIIWGDDQAARFESRKDDEDFVYRGIDVNVLESGAKAGEILGNIWGSVWDTLGFFKSDSTVGAYTRALPATFNAALSYTLEEKHRFGLLFTGRFYNRYFAPEIGVSYTVMPCKNFALSVSNTFCSGNMLNFGLSFAVNAGPVQLYAGIDRLNSFDVSKMRTASVNFGINFVFGKNAYDWYTNR